MKIKEVFRKANSRDDLSLVSLHLLEQYYRASLVAQVVKNLPAMWET